MEISEVCFRIKFVSGEPDVVVSVESTASFRLVIAKVCSSAFSTSSAYHVLVLAEVAEANTARTRSIFWGLYAVMSTSCVCSTIFCVSTSFLSSRSQIRDVKEWKQTKNVRLICSGRELFPGDMVLTAPGDVLHCIATEWTPPPQVQRKPPQLQVHPSTPEELPLDWVRN